MPNLPPLPRKHVARPLPFEFTGLDYFGPMYIKQFVQASEGIKTIVSNVLIHLLSCQ